jgi:hypothetical protein
VKELRRWEADPTEGQLAQLERRAAFVARASSADEAAAEVEGFIRRRFDGSSTE